MKKNSLHDLVSVLKDYEGFNESKYEFLDEHPPVAHYKSPFKFFQVIFGEKGYVFENFSLEGLEIDFFYHADRKIDSITLKGLRRNEEDFNKKTLLGRIARYIGRKNRVAFCHYYDIEEDYYGQYQKVQDYAYVAKADIENLKKKIESVKKSDRALTEIVENFKKKINVKQL